VFAIWERHGAEDFKNTTTGNKIFPSRIQISGATETVPIINTVYTAVHSEKSEFKSHKKEVNGQENFFPINLVQ
jgi:hypothetical protein